MNDNIKETITTKEEIDNILKEDRDWQNSETIKPEINQSVVIRISNPAITCWEDDTHIYHLEDSVVGQWKGDHWEINPPFHKYDYSPLSINNILKEGAIVTHWAICQDEEIHGWKHRLDFFHDYDKLNINIDSKHEESVYRAIVMASSFIEDAFNRVNDPNVEKELREYYETLKDLQYAIDNGGIL